MAEPFLSEIRIMSFGFAPRGWATCDGQLLPINQNQPLFSLLGTTFGGNGQTTFALPDNRGRVPMHVGNGHTLGERGGSESVTLITSQLPQHTHTVGAVSSGSVAGNSLNATNNLLGTTTPSNLYTNSGGNVVLNASTITSVGGSQAHENRQPFLTLNFCIALQGIFPSPN